jgi:hypothetical protein
MATSTLQKIQPKKEEIIICVFGQGPENPESKEEFCADWKNYEIGKGRLEADESPCTTCLFRLHDFN